MAPVVYTSNHLSVLTTLVDKLEIAELLHYYLDGLLQQSFLPAYGVYGLHYFPRVSLNFICALVGYDREQHIDLSFLPMMARNDIGGTSTKDMLHWI